MNLHLASLIPFQHGVKSEHRHRSGNKSQISRLTPGLLSSTRSAKGLVIILCVTLIRPVLAVDTGTGKISESQNPEGPKFHNVNEVLDASHSASDSQQKIAIMSELPKIPLARPDEVQAVYDETDRIRSEFKKNVTASSSRAEVYHYLDLYTSLTQTLSNAKDPAVHAKVADLLEAESKRLPSFFAGAREARSHADYLEKLPDTALLEALMTAAGEGKNREALPLLRRMAKRKDMAAGLAVHAISLIGDPKDLDDFIEKLKSNSTEKVDLSGFGGPMISRIVAELNNPSTPLETKHRLAGYLMYARGPEAGTALLALTRGPDMKIAESAAMALVRSQTPPDLATVRELLKDPKFVVRYSVLDVLDDGPWNPSYEPLVINLLLHDPTEIVRLSAIHLIVSHKIQNAAPALEQASKDPSVRIKNAATEALRSLNR